jgi:hypothetical protein
MPRWIVISAHENLPRKRRLTADKVAFEFTRRVFAGKPFAASLVSDDR